MTIDKHYSPDLTLQQLIEWLKTEGIDTTAWGQGDAKSVADLWQELQHGESTLQADPPLRRVQVVEVYVQEGDRLLIERAQHFADGRVRTRNRPPSEKMHPAEAPLEAAQRCLVEELMLAPSVIHFPPQPIPVRTVRDKSDSYPNLTSEYTFYTIFAHVNGLPTTSFTTPNAAHSDGDPIIAHQWEWVAT